MDNSQSVSSAQSGNPKAESEELVLYTSEQELPTRSGPLSGTSPVTKSRTIYALMGTLLTVDKVEFRTNLSESWQQKIPDDVDKLAVEIAIKMKDVKDQGHASHTDALNTYNIRWGSDNDAKGENLCKILAIRSLHKLLKASFIAMKENHADQIHVFLKSDNFPGIFNLHVEAL